MSEEFGNDIINLSDDEGNEYSFEVLDAIETDEGRYLAMLPLAEGDENEDNGDLVIVKVSEDEKLEEYFEDIEDEEEYAGVAEIFIERLNEAYEIE